MAMGKKPQEHQDTLWVATHELPQAPGHPFYAKLNEVLERHGFTAFVEGECQQYYAEVMGRPSIPPGVYFRMLFIGFFEGIDSERGIAWRVADSMGLRRFLDYDLTQNTPDHSSLSRTRHRLSMETHCAVFSWVLGVLAKEQVLKGKTLGIDATTLEANAALRSIVRRDTGESYQEFLTKLAKASGIETPTREDLSKIDKNRPGKGSNKDWGHPHDPDARITKMKDGQTHLAHKAEHAVDMDTGAIVAVTLQGADKGDTYTVLETLRETVNNLVAVNEDTDAARAMGDDTLRQAVMDKGYHSNESLMLLDAVQIRAYVSEPKRGNRQWKDKSDEQRVVYGNRRRIRGAHGKALLRRRGEFVERSFAHMYETGGMRRTHLKGHENILKRLLIHAGGFNLALVLRKLTGTGKPRRLQDGVAAAFTAADRWSRLLMVTTNVIQALVRPWRQPKKPESHLGGIYQIA